jgi:ADP-ribose pyrophosphatase YjhB (NUDIX family)
VTFEHLPSGIAPHPETLASRDDVVARRKSRAVDAERFEAAHDRVADGLTWGVGAITTDDQGRVLLVREDGEWLAPGGEVEAGESHEDALHREVYEETGVDVSVGDLVAVTEVSITHGERTTSFYFAHYTATPEHTTVDPDPGLPDEDIERVEWVETLPEDTVDRAILEMHR